MKKFTVFLLIFVFAFQSILCYGANINEDMVYTDFSLCFANVYLANDHNESLILRNVRRNNGYGSTEAVLPLEYTELSVIKENIFSKEGKCLTFDEINTYLLDQKIVFLVASNQYGYKLLYVEFV